MNGAGMFRRLVDWFMGGQGAHSITVPVMDGALKPNNYLEHMLGVASVDGADNLVAADGRTLLSARARLVELHPDGSTSTLKSLEADITFLCASAEGAIAVGLDGRGIAMLGGRHDGKRLAASVGGHPLGCPTAALFLDEDTLVVANGSATSGAGDWSRDLLSLGRSGSVVRIDLAQDRAALLHGGLGYASGLAPTPGGRLVVAEAWRHRLLTMDRSGGDVRVALDDLPAYPGRILPAKAGGYWLAMFAVRSQLQEFVLREHRYRREMMAGVDPEYWIAPALSSGQSFKEPLQAGSVIRLGIHKPWAPTRSYGLVLRLDDDFQPVWSAHSRADGSRHGITSCVESGNRLYVASKGRGEVIAIDHLALSEPEDLALQIASAA